MIRRPWITGGIWALHDEASRVGHRHRARPKMPPHVEERNGQAMLGFVRRLGLDDEEAQDCVQDTTSIDGLGVAPNGRVWAAQWSIDAVQILELP
jgi:hypothetical protein